MKYSELRAAETETLHEPGHFHHHYHSRRGSFSQKSAMRKYYKLALVVVTVTSLVFLIFYKTQYDKLYSVLQVMDFYGLGTAPVGSSPVQCSPEGNAPKISPSFHNFNQDLAIYSAFCQSRPTSLTDVDGNLCEIVSALAVSRKNSFKESSISCQLWYDGVRLPKNGVLFTTEIKLTQNSSFSIFQLNCENKFSERVPYGVSFQDNTGEAFIHVNQPLPTGSFPIPGRAGACLLPQNRSIDIDLTHMRLQNVLLNNFFGIETFLIYDEYVSHKTLEVLDEAQRSAGGLLSVKFVPFNSPFKLDDEIIQQIVTHDCFWRTRKLWETRVVLNSTQVLVPKSTRNLLKSLTRSHYVGELEVKVRKFCSELPAEDSSASNTYSITALEQTSFLNQEKTEEVMLLVQHKKHSSSTDWFIVDSDDIVVHDYAPCNRFDFEDDEIRKDLYLAQLKSEVQDKIGKFFPYKSL